MLKLSTSQTIPKVHYDQLQKGLSNQQIAEIKEAGVVIVRGAVPKEVRRCSSISSDIYVDAPAQEALGWKQSIREYIAENRGKVVGQLVIPTPQIIIIPTIVRRLP